MPGSTRSFLETWPPRMWTWRNLWEWGVKIYILRWGFVKDGGLRERLCALGLLGFIRAEFKYRRIR